MPEPCSTRALAIAVSLALSIPCQAVAEESGPAAQIVQLRREVDDLAQQLTDRRREIRGELAALRAERAELKRQLRLEQVRAQAHLQLERQQAEQVETEQARSEAALDPARAAVEAARTYVRTALPFKSQARLKVLDRIEAELSGSRPDVGRALTRLWRFVEEEQALTSEVGLAQQPIQLEGQRLLVDVVHVGMALLYARTPDGRFAWATSSRDGWRFVILGDAESVELVRTLFASVQDNRQYGPSRLLIPAGLGDRPGSGT